MLAIDDLVRDYGDPQVEQSNKDRLWVLLVEKIAPAGFVAIDILRIEAGFFLFTNECRVAPAITKLGLSELFDPGTQSPDIQLVAFEGGSTKGLKLTLWQSTDTAIRRPDRGEITVTSACFSPHFDRVPGLGLYFTAINVIPCTIRCTSFSTFNYARSHPMTRINKGLEARGRIVHGENYQPIKRSSLTVFLSPT